MKRRYEFEVSRVGFEVRGKDFEIIFNQMDDGKLQLSHLQGAAGEHIYMLPTL